jgi:hypothetical protein
MTDHDPLCELTVSTHHSCVCEIIKQARQEARNGFATVVKRVTCGGQHHGNGSPECPRELHHHHDMTCDIGNRILDAMIKAREGKL